MEINIIKENCNGKSGTFRTGWFNPKAGDVMDGGIMAGGATRFLKVPFNDAVLHLYRQSVGNEENQ